MRDQAIYLYYFIQIFGLQKIRFSTNHVTNEV